MGGSTDITIPDGMPCPACEYDLRGLAEAQCPECGHMITAHDIAVFRGTALLNSADFKGWRLHVAAWVVVIVGSAFGLSYFGTVATPTGVSFILMPFAFFGLTLGILASLAAGWALPSTVWKRNNPTVNALWFRTLGLLHVPWLGVVVGSPALLVMAVSTQDELAIADAIDVIFPWWFIGSGLALCLWSALWLRGIHKARAHSKKLVQSGVCIGAVVMLVAMCAGAIVANVVSGGAQRVAAHGFAGPEPQMPYR